MELVHLSDLALRTGLLTIETILRSRGCKDLRDWELEEVIKGCFPNCVRGFSLKGFGQEENVCFLLN